MSDCLVIMRLSSAARNSAARAISSPSSVALDRLALDHRLDRLRRLVPELALPVGHHGAGLDGVDADVVLPESARERAREPDHAGLGRGIGRHFRRRRAAMRSRKD